MKLLFAEDDRDISKAVTTVLQGQNYGVDTVFTGTDAYVYGVSGKYDGIILDIMMPGMDGLEVLRRLRREKIQTPVLLLTARGELEDRVAGLDSGADDYLAKPFAISELLARIRAMLRRKGDFTPDILSFGGLELNRSTFELVFAGKRQALVGREFQVFERLMERTGSIISTDSLMEQIWGWDSEVEVSIVWVTVSNLRKKLAALHAPVEIHTVRGVGYKLEETQCSGN